MPEAPSCTWTYPTSPGSPGPSDDVCIQSGIYVTYGGTWNSLTIESGAGLWVGDTFNEGCAPPPITLTLTNGGVIQSGASLSLNSSTTCFEGGDSTVVVGAGTLANAGTIVSDLCLSNGVSTNCYGGYRHIDGSVTNTGNVTVDDQLDLQGPGTFDNQGAFDVADNQLAIVLAASAGQGLTFFDDTGGSIVTSGDGSSGQLQVQGGNTYQQGAGTTSGVPVKIADSSLTYTGAGASTLVFGGTGALSGNVSPGQSLIISGITSCGATANAQISSDLVNSGSITLSGVPGCQPGSNAEISVISGTFTNSGTLTMAGPGASPITTSCSGACALSGNIVNIGVINVNASLNLSGPGTFDNKGPMTIADGQGVTVLGAGVGQGLTFIDDTGGSIATSGDGSSGQLTVQGGNTFEQGNGTITGTAPLLTGDTLDYVGTGISHLDVQGAITLAGNIAAQQTLELQNSGGFCQWPTPAVTAATGFTNAGTIITTACNGGPTLTVISGTLLNVGQIVSSAGLVLHATVTNRGTIQANYNTTVSIDALTNYSATTHTLSGGTYLLEGAGTLVVPGMDIQTNAATIDLFGGQLSDGGTNSLQGLTHNAKILALAGGTSLTTSSLTNAGLISLGPNDTLQVNGSYTQTTKGQLTPTIAGTSGGSTFGQLRVSGLATLGGSLDVVTGTGYTPTAGDTQQVVLYGSRGGQFAAINGTSAGSGLHFVLEYDPNAASFVVRATQVTVSPKSGLPGAAVTVTGSGFSPGETVKISFSDKGSTALTPAVADGTGSFTIGETIPSTAAAGIASISARGQTSHVSVATAFKVT